MSKMYFHYQQEGKESAWQIVMSQDRAKVAAQKPAFMTVLDLSTIPDDNDWSKVRYSGPFYADFDADGDLELVCNSFREFLGKLYAELDFDIGQAKMFASGGKGFHIEIPEACFHAKVPASGVTWLPYIYRAMAQSLIVDTLDLNVYTGKRGRMWRTTNVLRDNGNYKVPLTVEEALSMTPELYNELVSAPRELVEPTPPFVNGKFAMLFDRSKDTVSSQMRGKKKRQEKANALLDPWKKARKTPPSIEMIMRGESLRDGVGFQSIAMQLAIYAATVEMPQAEFIDRCAGLIDNHKSDSRRYNTDKKRREELSRMYVYMTENSLYDFDAGPVVRLLADGTPTADLGVMDTEDRDDTAVVERGPATTDVEDGDVATDEPVINLDAHKRLRRGFFMNAEGMFRKHGDEIEPISRATLRKVEAFRDVVRGDFQGYEFDMVVAGRKRGRYMLSADAFTSAQNLRKFFTAHQISFQGSEADAASLLDIMAEKAERNGHTYTYPREGFFVLNNPEIEKPTPCMVYLTKDEFACSIKPGDEHFFSLKYKPTTVTSSYDIDIHQAPDLDVDMADSIRDIFAMNRPVLVADVLGWFVACHYRSLYLHLFGQFPLLQVYGEAGSGKSQTIKTMAHLHWYHPERISIKSAMSATPFAMDAHASSSHSAPFIIDEYKPRELRTHKGKIEKLKDVFKACYMGTDIGERGTLNKGAENSLAIIKSKCTAPVAFMGEAIEMETAIIERSVCVPFSQAFHTKDRADAFERLQSNPECLSAIGKAIVNAGFRINLEAMRKEFLLIRREIEARLPAMDDSSHKRPAPRLIYNRAVVVHGLRIFKRILAETFDTQFDGLVDMLLNARVETEGEDAKALKIHSMSEISKVVSRLALMSRDVDLPHELKMGKDYYVGDGFVEIKVERSYDQYRRYCSSIRDTPLFDTLESFRHALLSYGALTDKQCVASELRDEDSSESIYRLSLAVLKREGVQNFR
jgi:hypothetical protein